MQAAEPAGRIAADVAGAQRRAVDVCSDCLHRIEELDVRIRAFLEVGARAARMQAEAVDQAVRAGQDPGPLAGVPLALKDNICKATGRTSCASRMLDDYRSPFDATVVERLRAAGAILIGKSNLDEFAMGSSNEHSAFGPTRNPWDLDRVPGGSSGGSAAAVASGMVPVALGSDTGGSVRLPAAYCGVVGLRPTYGRVSRYGLVAYASSLDQIGPLARTVEDAALVLGVISGHDPRDATSVDTPVPDYVAALHDDALDRAVRGLRVGVSRAQLGAGLDNESGAAIEAALAVYRSLGVDVVDVQQPELEPATAAYYIIAMAEAASNLARFDGVHYGNRAEAETIDALYADSRSAGLGETVKQRIMLGTFALSAGYYEAYYLRAQRVRRLVRDTLAGAFQHCDLIATPASPSPAFRLGERRNDPLGLFRADAFTVSPSLAGIPALSLPCGFTSAGLPIGLQLMAPHFEETRLLQGARLLERATDWHLRRPDLPPT